LHLSDWFTEANIKQLLETYASYGPVPALLLTFLKSYIPPIPSMVLISVNAAVYGLWWGFLYSYIGLVTGCITFFLLLRRLAGTRLAERLTNKPKVQKSLDWVRNHGFSYVFLLSLFPIGPFVIINIVSAAARMAIRKFITAIVLGKAVMVFYISYFGRDWQSFLHEPIKLFILVVFLALSILVSRRMERRFTN
jgi:uncharacterized membrane protein YdjX (TVP38/TMEM64 family)